MKALIAMSGGVDSSVAAALMIKRGYECVGVTMKLHGAKDLHIDTENACCTSQDIEDARAIANKLGMPYEVVDFEDDFKCKVMDKFVDCYMKGLTPNPCIDCNRYLKFERLYQHAKELHCDVIVTGHYAQVDHDENTGRYYVKKAVDHSKDQSYVLYSLTQDQLAHTLFPLGAYSKEEVRKMAEEFGLLNARKKDSQDICFVPDGNYKRFIEEYAGKICPPGDFVDLDGNILGTHTGICNYTIGQRKGLGISAKAPLFVKEIDPEKNQVILSDNESLFTSVLYAKDFNWMSTAPIAQSDMLRVDGKVRYRHNASAATCSVEKDLIKVEFDEPQRAITCGQAVVLYDQDKIAGGGTICKVPLE